MLRIADLFAGCGGASAGFTQAGARVELAIEADPHIARVYARNFDDHAPRVQTLGASAAETEALAAELAGYDHVHASPPCQRLSQANQTTRDAEQGLALVRWYLDLVARVAPPTWSMEQVPHPAVKALLDARGVRWTCVTASDFGVPQHRARLVAGSPGIVKALAHRADSGPTVLPRDVLPALQPASRYRLCSGTTNQPLKQRRGGVRYTIGSRPMRPGEGGRALDEPCHCVFSKPARVYDKEHDQTARRLTPDECAALQGFPPDYALDERSVRRSYIVVGNALPPPLGRAIVEAAMGAQGKKKTLRP